MDFRLTQEQELLRDGARRYFATDGSVEKRGQSAEKGEVAWTHFADSGWLAMLVPEEQNGLGSPLEDIAILCEEMGRGLSASAFIGGAILPARIAARCAASQPGVSILTAIVEGAARFAVAAYEPSHRYELLPRTRALTADGGWRLTGEKSLVSGGARADRLIVSATVDDESRPALFVINAKASGVSRRVYETLDGVEAADFGFSDVLVSSEDRLAGADSALDILQAALDEALICLCAETLGGIDRAIELTADYLKTRKQFGQSLAEFQVLQHTVAELWIEANSVRSILYRAIAASAASPAERSRAASGCFIKLMQAAKSISGTAIHLHGGIGVSCEYPVGHYLRRVLVSERMLGDREHHLQRYMGS